MLEFGKRRAPPRYITSAAVFGNSCSILEAFRMVEEITGQADELAVRGRESHRRSHLLLQRLAEDAIALSGMAARKSRCRTIFEEIVAAWRERLAGAVA